MFFFLPGTFREAMKLLLLNKSSVFAIPLEPSVSNELQTFKEFYTHLINTFRIAFHIYFIHCNFLLP